MTISDTDFPILGDDGPGPMAQLRGYWEGLRRDGNIPRRSQISPRGIETALSATFLIERVAPGIARFRIAGMDLVDLMGMEVRGMPFSTLFAPFARTDLATKLEILFHNPAILTMDLTAEPAIARPALSAQLLALPLRDEQDRITLALGCLTLLGKIGRSPRRFEIAKSSLSHLALPSHVAARAFTPKVLEGRSFGEPAAAFCSKPARAPYLRLVK